MKKTEKIYFHCGKNGHRNDSLKNNNKVSFCVYDKGYIKEGEWALNIKSVVIFGRANFIDNIDLIKEIMVKLSLKFTDDEKYIRNELEAFADSTLIIELTPEHICGKFVSES